MRIPRPSEKRRAVAGILAAVILFAMLFTAGLGFFLYQNTLSHQYDMASVANQQALQAKVSQSLELTTHPSAPATFANVSVLITNTGGEASKVTGLYVQDQNGKLVCLSPVSGSIPSCNPLIVASPSSMRVLMSSGSSFSLASGQGLNVTVSCGAGSFCPGATYSSNAPALAGCNSPIKSGCAVGVLTQLGNTFPAPYPPVATIVNNFGCIIGNACQAFNSLVSQGLGFIAMDFNLVQAWTITCPGSNDPALGGCTVNGFPASYNNPVGQNLGNRYSGYAISKAAVGSNWLMFSLNLTNADLSGRTITLTPSSDITGNHRADGSALIQSSTVAVASGGGTASVGVYIMGGVCGVTIPTPCGGGILYGQTLTPRNIPLQGCTFNPLVCHPVIVFFYAPVGQATGIPVAVPQVGGSPANVVVGNLMYLVGSTASGGGISPKLGTACPGPGNCPFGQDLPFTTTVYTP